MAHRGVDVAIGEPRGAERTSRASRRVVLTVTGRPSARLTRTSSESSRKRLQATSTAASTSSSSARAFESIAGSVTASVAVVPRAGNVTDATSRSTGWVMTLRSERRCDAA